jgi:ABC-2 type transport system permease protein
VLLFNFFTRVMHGVAGVFLEEVWSRNFLNLFASPGKQNSETATDGSL